MVHKIPRTGTNIVRIGLSLCLIDRVRFLSIAVKCTAAIFFFQWWITDKVLKYLHNFTIR